ncbi:hypothetical protein LPC10_01560 [Methylorubrum sp. B1-46]|jgi:hypothetical protein|uniref:hypothetical protein n=1 Tax=Methylorubrum sp. B1-46 TaxID=2897334 RepID=UPI001E49E584|nr:hypothetical protein [Methylorubrum sp. B1-46]UGB28336.1 hypothetical protein LPC10_01560 [Methylorubrum sp. B1-46]
MDTKGFPKPINDTQREFLRLCELGGGARGGPPRGKVLEVLRANGKSLNMLAHAEAQAHLAAYPDANPWHLCFAIGLSWGHLARLDVDFTGAVAGVLANWNSGDLAAAKSFHMERGPEPIEQSLRGAHYLFARVILPKTLPSTLDRLDTAQQRWISPILTGSDRPRYIGSWNATAMFMAALFAQPSLAALQTEPRPMLPPGGPIFKGLQMLHKAGLLKDPPSGSELDDQAFEPGSLYENNKHLADLCAGLPGWSLIDVHSGVYMLGTRHPHSGKWV